MTEAEFRRALRVGLGRALQFARTARPFPYRQALLDSCVECQTYDKQVDGTLGNFTWEVLEASGEKQSCRGAVLASLATCGDDYHAEKRYWLAMCFALEGDDEMRRAMYEHFRLGPRHGAGIAIVLVELDGLQGFLFAAGKFGAAMHEGERWDSDWFLSHSRDVLGEENVRQALTDAAGTNPDIAKFLAEAEYVDPPKPATTATDELISFEELCAQPKRRTSAMGWGRRASGPELAKAADAVLARGQQEPWLLGIFHRPPFPGDPAALIAWAESDQTELSRRACLALRNVEHPDVRALGIRLRDAALLKRNSQPGDHAMILRWLDEAVDDEEVHSLGQDALDFWEAHPNSETEILRTVYARTPCTQCRETAVRRMIELGNVPPEIAEECAFDGNEEIRALTFC